MRAKVRGAGVVALLAAVLAGGVSGAVGAGALPEDATSLASGTAVAVVLAALVWCGYYRVIAPVVVGAVPLTLLFLSPFTLADSIPRLYFWGTFGAGVLLTFLAALFLVHVADRFGTPNRDAILGAFTF